MVQRKHVVRTYQPRKRQVFDDQQWPVDMALVVFGGFMIGSILVYQRFDDPRWYASPWLSMIGVVLLIATTIWTLRSVGNQFVRRTMQLSVVICAIFHLMMLIVALENTIFSQIWEEPQAAREVSEKKPVTIAEYHPSQMEQHQKVEREFEKPVETEVAQPTPREIERPDQEQPQTPVPPQPQPVPEPVQKVQPEVVKQRATSAVAQPRQSDQQSKLSRQQTKAVKSQNAAVTVPQPTPAARDSNPQLQTRATAVTRTQASSQQQRKQTNNEPTQAAAQQASNVQRATRQQQQPTTNRTAQPTMQRRSTTAQQLPRTQVEPVQQSAVSVKTPTPATKPANTVARQATTAAPQRTQTPTSEMTASTSQATQQVARQQPSPRKPTLAQTPQPVSNRSPRLTQRPNPQTQAQVATPRLPNPVTQNPSRNLAARSSQVSRATTETTVSRRQVKENSNPTTVSSATRANRATRQQAEPLRNTTQNANQVERRQTTTLAQAAAPTVVTPTANPGAKSTQPATAQPSASRVVKQAASSRAPSRTPVNPSQLAPATASLAATSQSVQRSVTGPQAPEAPAPAAQVASNTQRRRQTTQSAGVASQAAVSQERVSPSATVQPTVQASATTVSRSRAASGATAQRATTAQTPAAPSTTASRSAAVRSNQVASKPTAASPATASNSLQRSQQQAQVAVSPQAVSQPAGSVQAAAAQPAQQPARSAVAKATGGVAGRGKSSNLDRALSAASNQATTASNSAARTRATRQNEAGPELAPAAVATIQRSRAGADRPSATLRPNTVELPNAVASNQPAQATLDAAASVSRSNAQAAEGAVTAAKGNVEVDTGATQLVDRQNVGRAAGGGQPEISSQPNAAPAAQNGKTAARAMIMSSQVAASAAAPAASSASEVAQGEAQPAASSVARRSTENRTPVSSPSAATDDPAGSPGGLPALAQGGARRAEQDTSPAAGVASEQPSSPSQGAGKTTSRQLPSSLSATQVATAAAPPSSPGDGGPAAASPAAASPAKLEVGKVAAGPQASASSSSPAPITDPLAGLPAQSGGAAAVQGPAISRAEATDGTRGQPELGGGTGQPQQVARGRPLLTPQIATTISVAGAAQSSGVDAGVPVEAQGNPAGRLAGGVNAPANDRASGANASEAMLDAPDTGSAGVAVASRQRKSDSAAGPAEISSDSPGGVVKRASVGRGLPTASTTVTVDVPGAAGGGETAGPATTPTISGAQTGPVARRATDNLPVRVAAEEGVGGLGNRIAADAGIASRRASPESMHVQIQPGRFLSKTSRGLPSFNTRAAVTTNSFQGRKRPGDGGGSGKSDPQTEEAIDLGLAFLARNQLQDGRWSLSQFAQIDGQPAMSSDTAATALSILAFQGAGYNHQQYKYQQVVRNGLQFLLSNQAESGDLYMYQGGHAAIRLYSHAMATLALCEAYGMTQDPDLREQVQKAIDFIVAAQHAERGGWRYVPGKESDTSVTGWMLMALESGRRANLNIPDKTFGKVRDWLEKSADPDLQHLYRYNPFADDTQEQRTHRSPTPTMTSVGLLMRLYTGWKTSENRMIKGADYLKENLPSLGVKAGVTQRDTYYWYYATQVMFHMGGEHWKAWNDRLHPLLVNSQIREGNLAGSWDFRRPVMDRWGPHAGRIYLTTMNLLSLEVHYRHLPLYEGSGKSGKVAAEQQD